MFVGLHKGTYNIFYRIIQALGGIYMKKLYLFGLGLSSFLFAMATPASWQFQYTFFNKNFPGQLQVLPDRRGECWEGVTPGKTTFNPNESPSPTDSLGDAYYSNSCGGWDPATGTQIFKLSLRQLVSGSTISFWKVTDLGSFGVRVSDDTPSFIVADSKLEQGVSASISCNPPGKKITFCTVTLSCDHNPMICWIFGTSSPAK